MATFKAPVTLKLTRKDLEGAILEYLDRRLYYPEGNLEIKSMEVHSSGGHALTVTVSQEKGEPDE